jgi:hypothetical protein
VASKAVASVLNRPGGCANTRPAASVFGLAGDQSRARGGKLARGFRQRHRVQRGAVRRWLRGAGDACRFSYSGISTSEATSEDSTPRRSIEPDGGRTAGTRKVGSIASRPAA